MFCHFFNSIQTNIMHKMPEVRYVSLNACRPHSTPSLHLLIYIHLKQTPLAACKTCVTWKASFCSPADMTSRYSRSACLVHVEQCPPVTSDLAFTAEEYEERPNSTRQKRTIRLEAAPPVVTDLIFYWLCVVEKFISSLPVCVQLKRIISKTLFA